MGRSVAVRYKAGSKTFGDTARDLRKLESVAEKNINLGLLKGAEQSKRIMKNRINKRLDTGRFPSRGGSYGGPPLGSNITIRKNTGAGDISWSVVTGNHPHARLMDYGTDFRLTPEIWEIPGESSAGPVSFIPQNQSLYPESSHGTGEYEGYVTLNQVDWKGRELGNRNASVGFGFSNDPDIAGKQDFIDETEDAVRESIKTVFAGR